MGGTAKEEILARLRREILSLQGGQAFPAEEAWDIGLDLGKGVFPGNVFPCGVIHEFWCAAPEEAAASGGFITGITRVLMKKRGAVIWVGRDVFPGALSFFGVEPDRFLFVRTKRLQDTLWAIEEALRYEGLAAVVGEVEALSFKASRRLQLAVEQSGVTGFILLRSAAPPSVSASFARWRIRPLPGLLDEALPGVGYPCWHTELLKIRNGKPGAWKIGWKKEAFCLITEEPRLFELQAGNRKAQVG